MKILLISPARDKNTYTNKGMMIPQLALFILEGLTPKEHQVRIIEEEYMPIDFDEDCYLVGISCMTSNAYRGYNISKEFKKRGKTIIMGGVHPSILPDEASRYADAVVIGEAEGVWEQLLQDVESNTLKERYHNPNPDLTKYVPKNFSSLKSKRLFNMLPILTTRGCPYNCDFCCVSDIYGKKIKHIPVENAVRDIVESKGKTFIFLDDNIIGDKKYARELFIAIKPLKIRWIGQASISFANDLEMMQLARDSGCKGLFIGLETVSESQIKQLKKLDNDIEKTKESLKKIRKMGIIIQASVIFGFDDDTTEIFQETLDFLIKNKISIAALNVLTPYPGTKLYENFKRDGRLISNKWEYYDHHTVVFKPTNMTAMELQVGKVNARREFFSIPSILKRFSGNLRTPLVYLVANMAYRKLVKEDKKRIAIIEAEMKGNERNDAFFIESLNKVVVEEEVLI